MSDKRQGFEEQEQGDRSINQSTARCCEHNPTLGREDLAYGATAACLYFTSSGVAESNRFDQVLSE